MPEHIGVGGAWKAVTGQWVGVGGAWKLVTQKWIGVGGAWKLAYSALTATAINIYKFADGPTLNGTVTSDATPAVTVSGGSGSYTYSWAHVSTSQGNTPTILSGGTTDSPRFTVTAQNLVPSISVWTVTVTDSTYLNSTTASPTITLEWDDNR